MGIEQKIRRLYNKGVVLSDLPTVLKGSVRRRRWQLNGTGLNGLLTDHFPF